MDIILSRASCTLHEDLDVKETQIADEHTPMTKRRYTIGNEPEWRKK